MKLGIVMEGGASRTIFSCGVTDCFLEENLMPDYFVGVSAGAAFGVSYLSGQKGRNRMVAEKYMADKRYMGFHHLLDKNKKTFYNLPFVFDEIPNHLIPFDYEAFGAFPGEAEAVVTNLHTGKPEYFDIPRNDPQAKVLTASCALPIFFQPIRLNNRYYMDGGVSDSIPFKRAWEKGCDKLIVILTRPRGYVKKADKSVKIATKIYRHYPKFVEVLKRRAEDYNQSVKELFEAEKEGKVFIIAPKESCGVGRLESSPEKLLHFYDEGYLHAKESMHALRIYLEKNK